MNIQGAPIIKYQIPRLYNLKVRRDIDKKSRQHEKSTLLEVERLLEVLSVSGAWEITRVQKSSEPENHQKV